MVLQHLILYTHPPSTGVLQHTPPLSKQMQCPYHFVHMMQRSAIPQHVCSKQCIKQVTGRSGWGEGRGTR